jgi:hypothetical protein
MKAPQSIVENDRHWLCMRAVRSRLVIPVTVVAIGPYRSEKHDLQITNR